MNLCARFMLGWIGFSGLGLAAAAEDKPPAPPDPYEPVVREWSGPVPGGSFKIKSIGEALTGEEAKPGTTTVILKRQWKGKIGPEEFPKSDIEIGLRPQPNGADLATPEDKALSFLARQLKQQRGLNLKTGQMGQFVTVALAGLAFLASGSTLEEGPCASALAQCDEILGRWKGQDIDGAWDQSTWGLAFSLLFLTELQAQRPAQARLQTITAFAKELAFRQTALGGWCHGKGGLNAAGYAELNGVGVWCLTALGCARRLKVDVPEPSIAHAVAYLTGSSNSNGGVGYSTRAGQAGLGEAGRSAGTLLGFLSVGQENHPLYPRLGTYLRANLEGLASGHGSPLCHLLAGALACRALGEESWSQFMKAYQARFRANQQPDGSFKALALEDFPELEVDRTTATLALILCLPRDHLKLLLPTGSAPAHRP